MSQSIPKRTQKYTYLYSNKMFWKKRSAFFNCVNDHKKKTESTEHTKIRKLNDH